MRTLPAACLAIVLVAARPAAAALTASETAVVKTHVQKGELASVLRVRSLVARPDLTPEEIVAPLRAGYAGVPFDEARERFTEALLFGPGSQAARNSLAVALVESLLARASSRMADVPLGPGARAGRKEREALAEILSIHRFVASRIANAGRPAWEGFDASQAIRADARLLCLRKYTEHLSAHATWLSLVGPVPAGRLLLASQVALTAANLAAGVVSRFEVSQALGLAGARRGVFERHGVIVVQEDRTSDARAAEAIALLEAAPGAARGLGLWVLGKTSVVGLSGRGDMERAGVVLSDATTPVEPEELWPDDVKASTPDRSLAALALQVADRAVRRALEGNATLGPRAELAAARAARVGPRGYLAVDVPRRSLARHGGEAVPPGARDVLAGAVRLTLLDAGRAVDLALIRAAGGQAEPLEQLVLALSVLSSGGKEVTVRRVDPGGSLSPLRITEIAHTDGLVSAFALPDRTLTVASGEGGDLRALVDGKVPKLTELPSFLVRAEAGSSWSFGGAEFERLSGEPRAVALDDGRFIVEGGTGGYDGIGTGAEEAAQGVSASMRVTAGSGALLVRARRGETSLSGIALVVEGSPSRARLLSFDGKGKAFELSPWSELPAEPPGGHVASLEITGDAVAGRIAGLTLEARAPASVGAEGRAGLAVLGGGRVEVRSLKLGKGARPKTK